MKRVGIALVLMLFGILAACGGGSGSSSSTGTVSGNWTATLTNEDSTPAYTFTTTLAQANGTVVTGTNLVFTASTDCFTSGGTQTGSFVLSGDVNGNLTGSFQLTIESGTPVGNTLTLTGTVSGNTITGTWVLSGVCSGSGNFTMTKM